MPKSTYTFLKLINEFSIVIPIIQRDYAQGRETAKDVRNSFLANIYNSLENKTHLELDFIYGIVKDSRFIPLDGQQRLTTLFLLHWYLAVKDGRNEDILSSLSKFSYETRTTSTDFCQALIKYTVSSTDNIYISEGIRDATWFLNAWEKDPSVSAMLNMLDAIQKTFADSSGFLNLLISTDNITFQFLNPESLKITNPEGLYIKMNARGKALTDFEHFKARFQQYLDLNHSQHKNRFAASIDNKWTDFFWHHKILNVIDEPFMKYFNFITEILYYVGTADGSFTKDNNTNNQAVITFDLIMKVYQKESNLLMLFDSLDLLCNIVDTKAFFSDLFSTQLHETGKVCLFSDKIDLFESCTATDKDFGIREKIFLFSLLKFCIERKISSVNQDLRDFIRLIRNLVFTIRQQRTTELQFILGYEMLPRILNGIFQTLISDNNVYEILLAELKITGFSSDSILHEQTKAKLVISDPRLKKTIEMLEDHANFKGNISNLDIEINAHKLEAFSTAISEVWDTRIAQELILQSVNTAKDFSVYADDSALGGKWYLGNTNKWETLFVKKDGRMIKSLTSYLSSYLEISEGMPIEKLKVMIAAYHAKVSTSSWKYYFSKYREIYNNHNLFAWKSDESNFRIRHLNHSGLNGFHINPYVRIVADKVENAICESGQCYGKGAEESALNLKNGIKLFCEEEGWKIVVPNNLELDNELLKMYTVNSTGTANEYLLQDQQGFDRIETAVAFCKLIPSYTRDIFAEVV